MPTGLTYEIYEGKPVSFERFLWRCARMMMPLIIMREDDLDKLPPEEFCSQDEYYAARLGERRGELAQIEAMSEFECLNEAAKEYESRAASVVELNASSAAKRARYETMLAKVLSWSPPTDDHRHLKEFMVRQLKDSMEVDCHLSELPVPPIDWRQERLEYLRRDIANLERYIAEENQRTAYRNAWLKTLRASVPYPTANPPHSGAQEG